ncbi:MAG: cation:H+ antiporter, partial [Oceanicoccus sp.]
MTQLLPLLPWLAILAGFIGLMWSADRFIDGSAAIANNFGVPKLLIGLTVVAFGTSAPEIVVSISASLKGAGEIAIGN